MSEFSAAIDSFIAKSNARINYVIKDSAQRVIDQAQQPTNKNGFMRVDTGFLRNSGMAKIGALPSGESINPMPDTKREKWDSSETVTTINRLRVGETLYFGWVANYAKHRENKDGFMRRAAQNWQQHVKNSIKEAKKALK